MFGEERAVGAKDEIDDWDQCLHDMLDPLTLTLVIDRDDPKRVRLFYCSEQRLMNKTRTHFLLLRAKSAV